MALDGTRVLQRAKMWRMKITLLKESAFREILKEQWGKWQRYTRYYPNKVIWWDTNVNRKIRQTFQREGAERNRDGREMENYYCDMIYRVIRDSTPQEEKTIHLRKLKAKIVRLHSIQQRGVLLDTEDRDRITGEISTIHQYLKSRKRRTMRTITQVQDENGIMKTGQTEVMGIFTAHITRRCAHIQINDRCIQELVSCEMNTLPMTANAALEEPITVDELITAVRKGKAHKSQGQDGICHEFYKVTWNIIKQDMLDVLNMYKNGSETEAQKLAH
jgi:hypothetical protein